MFEILKFLPIPALYGVIAMLLIKLGNSLKSKDADDAGADDVAGDICIAFAPAIAALEDNNDSALRKALKCVGDAINAYLATHPKKVPDGATP